MWDSPSGRGKQPSVGTNVEPATELLEEMIAGPQLFSERVGDRRNTDLAAITDLNYPEINALPSPQGNKNDSSGRRTLPR